MKILIMDDEPLVLKLLENYLTMLDHQVVTVLDGQKGLEVFLQAPDIFDLIITDLQMPGLDGMNVIVRLKDKGYEIPVVLISGYAVPNTEEEIRNLKIVAVLEKPFDLQELGKVVSEVEKAKSKQ